MYLKRGAIAPPDACERCEVPSQISPSRPLRPLLPFHPDPARKRLIAWLCAECRRRVERHRRAAYADLDLAGDRGPAQPQAARSSGACSGGGGGAGGDLPEARGLAALRDAAFVRILMRALAPGERERLYAAGCLAGPRWLPTGDAHLDAILRSWIFNERAERRMTARAAGGIEVAPLLAEPRRRREPPPAPARESRPAFDPEAAWAAIQRAAEALDAAEDVAMKINARVARAVRDRFN